MTGNDIVVDLNGDMLDVHTTVVMSSHVPSCHDEYSSGLEDTCFGPPKGVQKVTSNWSVCGW